MRTRNNMRYLVMIYKNSSDKISSDKIFPLTKFFHPTKVASILSDDFLSKNFAWAYSCFCSILDKNKQRCNKISLQEALVEITAWWLRSKYLQKIYRHFRNIGKQIYQIWDIAKGFRGRIHQTLVECSRKNSHVTFNS